MTDMTPQEAPVRCPRCSSTQIQAVQKNGGMGFDAAGGVCAGLIGAICLGPIGLLFTLCGLSDKGPSRLVRMCLNCGHEF